MRYLCLVDITWDKTYGWFFYFILFAKMSYVFHSILVAIEPNIPQIPLGGENDYSPRAKNRYKLRAVVGAGSTGSRPPACGQVSSVSCWASWAGGEPSSSTRASKMYPPYPRPKLNPRVPYPLLLPKNPSRR